MAGGTGGGQRRRTSGRGAQAGCRGRLCRVNRDQGSQRRDAGAARCWLPAAGCRRGRSSGSSVGGWASPGRMPPAHGGRRGIFRPNRGAGSGGVVTVGRAAELVFYSCAGFFGRLLGGWGDGGAGVADLARRGGPLVLVWGGAAAGGGLDVSAGLDVFWRGCWGSAITCWRFSWRWGLWCRARLPTVTSGAGAMLVVEDVLLQGALVGVGGVAVDALWRVRWRCREMSDFRGPLWTARVDAPTPVHDLTQRRFSRAGFSWRPSRWCRRPLGGSRGSRGGEWRALSGCSLPVGIMDAPAAGAGSVAMRVMGPGEVSDASPGLVEPAESVRGVGANRVGLAAPL